MPKLRNKNRAERDLALPDLEQATSAVLNTLTSAVVIAAYDASGTYPAMYKSRLESPSTCSDLQHGVTILLSFALFGADQLALTVDVAYSKRHRL